MRGVLLPLLHINKKTIYFGSYLPSEYNGDSLDSWGKKHPEANILRGAKAALDLGLPLPAIFVNQWSQEIQISKERNPGWLSWDKQTAITRAD